jgi:zona occludens toxin (predicted ATPase)
VIYLYYGKIGDGKTYHVMANELLPAVRSGRKIYTNIDGLNIKQIAMATGKLPYEVNIEHIENPNTIKELMTIDANDKEGHSLKLERGSMVIIDEAQMIWDAREFKDTKKGFLSLLEYHRHFGLDFVFITQNPKRLEVTISRLSNESYQVKNLGFLGAFLKGRYVMHSRQSPYDRDIISTTRGTYRDEVFACYRSFVSKTNKTHKTKSAMSGGIWYAVPLVMAFLAVMFVARGGFSFMSKKENVRPQASHTGNKEVTANGNSSINSKVSDNFIYSSSPAGSVAVAQKEVSPDIGVNDDDCVRYSGISGKGYKRRANTVLVRLPDGVWTNKQLSCESDQQITSNAEEKES